MRINKLLVTLGLVLSMLLGSGVAVADYDSAYSSYTSKDYKTAFKEMLPHAEAGHVNAQYMVAWMYETGSGIQKNLPAALQWYTKSAGQGDSGAQYNLGVMYYYDKGALENAKTAVRWYSKAAVQGDAKAQNNLGVMYRYGEGALSDTKRAYMWYNIAAYNGSDFAAESKSRVAKIMTPSQVEKAQEMSSRCLASDYKDC